MKVLHLHARQAVFLNKVQEMMSNEIASLDRCFHYKHGEYASIYECIMGIQLSEHDYLPEFVNVAQQYNGHGVVSTFIPQLESEARTMVASLVPFFCYAAILGEVIEHDVTPEAWELHSDTMWDPETGMAITPDDKLVEEIAKADPAFMWIEPKPGTTITMNLLT